MRTIALAVLVAMTVADTACAQTITRAAIHPDPGETAVPLHTGGRMIHDGDGYRHQWPGVYFEGAFEGQAVTLRFDGGATRYRLSIDHAPVAVLSVEGPVEYRVTGLIAGRHEVRIDKISESYHATAVFNGAFVPEDEKPLPAPAPRARQIEVIGDSYTSGFANTLEKLDCTDPEANAATDTAQTFGPVLAAKIDADYQINAYSGLGVVRNYDTQKGDPVLPDLYPGALYSGQAYDHAGWQPQVIFVALGGNDFSEPFTPTLRWSKMDDVRPDFIAGYTAFLKTVRQQNPHAEIALLLFGDGVTYGQPSAQADDAEVMRRLNDPNVYVVNVGGELKQAACYGHLTTGDSRLIADRLMDFLKAHPPAWP